MKQIYQKLDEFFITNRITIKQDFIDSSYSVFNIAQEPHQIKLKDIKFLKDGNIRDKDDEFLRSVLEKLELEIDSWSDDLFLQIFEINKNREIKKILNSKKNLIRYTTSPLTLENITPENMGKYARVLSNEDLLGVFIKKIIDNSIVDKETIKDYLVSKNKFKTLNYFFPQNLQDIVEETPPAMSCFKVNFHLMPISDAAKKTNSSAHAPFSINVLLIEMIKHFQIVNPEDSPVYGIFTEQMTPKDGIKKIYITAQDKNTAKAFGYVFLDLLKSNLRERQYISKSNALTNIDHDKIHDMLEQTKKMALSFVLDNALEGKTVGSIKSKI